MSKIFNVHNFMITFNIWNYECNNNFSIKLILELLGKKKHTHNVLKVDNQTFPEQIYSTDLIIIIRFLIKHEAKNAIPLKPRKFKN